MCGFYGKSLAKSQERKDKTETFESHVNVPCPAAPWGICGCIYCRDVVEETVGTSPKPRTGSPSQTPSLYPRATRSCAHLKGLPSFPLRITWTLNIKQHISLWITESSWREGSAIPKPQGGLAASQHPTHTTPRSQARHTQPRPCLGASSSCLRSPWVTMQKTSVCASSSQICRAKKHSLFPSARKLWNLFAPS